MTTNPSSSRLGRNLLIGGGVVFVLLFIAYFGIGYVIYGQLGAVQPLCAAGDDAINLPTDFTNSVIADTTPYLSATYEDVQFPARGNPEITISAFFVPAQGVDNPNDAPTVIVVHGLNSCKRDETNLMAMGILSQNGFNVIAPDLRDHGDSTVEDGRASLGVREHRDVLGAFDWLVDVQGVNPDTIGIMGFSMGAATASVTFGEEPRLRALWLDSSLGDINDVIDAELARNGLPGFLKEGALLISQLRDGVNLRQYSTVSEMDRANGRPVFLTHGTADTRLSVQYSRDLAERLEANGGTYELWIVEGTEHVQNINVYPDEYSEKLINFFRMALTPSS
jgi:uncharacterized protein